MGEPETLAPRHQAPSWQTMGKPQARISRWNLIQTAPDPPPGLTIGSDVKYVPGKGEVKDPSRIFVVDALEGYAWDAGVRTGDHITKVDGVSVDGKDLQEITGMLRGVPGTKVTVTYERDGVQGSSEAVLSRKSVRIKDVPVATFMGPKSDGIGYILLRGFAVDSGKEVAQAIEGLQKQAKLKAIVLDLRGNPGKPLDSGSSSLSSAVHFSGYFWRLVCAAAAQRFQFFYLWGLAHVLLGGGRRAADERRRRRRDLPRPQSFDCVDKGEDGTGSDAELLCGR